MSRTRKPESKDHAVVITADGKGELALVKGGAGRAYVWIGPSRGETGDVYTFSGKAALSALAKAILQEINR